MFSNKVVITVAMLLCSVCNIQTATAVTGPFIFDWGVRNRVVPGLDGITPSPFVGHDYEADHEWYVDLYDQMYAADRAISLMLVPGTNPINGSEDMYALSTVMSYAPRLNFVWADFEDENQNAETTEMIRQVRTNSNPSINSAYVANYGDYPGATDVSANWPEDVNRAARDAFYRNSGTNIANPSCYPYEYYEIHTSSYTWGTNVCPNKRSALFWTPLERVSVAKRNLPAGHLLIPWVARFIEWAGYDAPIPTREDVRALMQHMRLRGADGYYRLAGILLLDENSMDGNEEYENQWDMFNAWHSLDKVFEGSGTVNILNLNTNKLGGIEWSGVQHGSKIAILVSNLGNSSQRVALPSIAGLPAYSDYVAPGEHMLRIYDIILPAADVSVKNNGTVTNALYTSWYSSDTNGPYCYLKFDLAGMIPPDGSKTVVKSFALKTNAPAVSGSLGSYTDAVYGVGQDNWNEANITWANKPSIGNQLASWATPVAAGWLNINSSNLTSFVEQQANGDGVVSFAIHDLNAARTNQQYQHYYDQTESVANCFQLAVQYEPVVKSTLPQTLTLDANDLVTISASEIRAKLMLSTSWNYGEAVTYLKYNLSALKPPLKYETVVDSVSIHCLTGNMYGALYNDAFYGTADTWSYTGITWSTKPSPGDELVSWAFPNGGYLPVTIPSTSAWKSYAQNEANGDGIMSLCMQDIGAANAESQYHAYYGTAVASPMPLSITYHFELSDIPTNCQEANSQHYGLVRDLNGDCYVDFKDFAIMAERWLR